MSKPMTDARKLPLAALGGFTAGLVLYFLTIYVADPVAFDGIVAFLWRGGR